MNDEQRTAVIIAEQAERECAACRWLGQEMDCTLWEGRSYAGSQCPACGSDNIRDYESALYRAGYR